jgi:hypothetical protein
MRDGNQNEDSTSRDFLGSLDELDDLTPTDQIAEHVGCSVEVAREWLFKLEDELATHTRGKDISPLWSRMLESLKSVIVWEKL